MERSKFLYPSLNGLRAISIILVICDHLKLNYGYFSHLPFIFSNILDGQLGVDVFFVISGFLITALLLKEEQSKGKISIKHFFIRRTLRIFPAYYFMLLVYFILTLFHVIEISKASWLTSLTYTKDFNWNLDWYTSHAWSLSIEEQFYIFWPLVFIAGKKARKYCLILIIILIPPFRVYNFYHPISWVDELSIFMRLNSIAAGCLCAVYQEEIIEKCKLHWKKIFYSSIVCIVFLASLKELNTLYHLHLSFIIILPFNSTIASLLIAALMMFSVFGPKGLWHKFLNIKIMNTIGILSYSIYLWQQFFLAKTEFWINQFPQNIFFILFASLFSFYVVEKPFLKLKQKFQTVKSAKV